MALIEPRRHLLLLLLLCCDADAQAPDKMPAFEKPAPVVNIKRQGSSFIVHAAVILPVTRCEAYALLTDYASQPSYIPGMLEIGVERISETVVKVRQLVEAHVLFFSIDVEIVLVMEEMPGRYITFRQTEGDLESYSGIWTLLDAAEGTKLTYDAELLFAGYVPGFLGKMVLEDESAKRFEAVAKEAGARKAGGRLSCNSAQSENDAPVSRYTAR
ncbi:MAG: SRPBCC family protein [Nitrosomonadales bacterium]|nr:SRPBCC family protein [Nitrosomonadales bacterium]